RQRLLAISEVVFMKWSTWVHSRASTVWGTRRVGFLTASRTLWRGQRLTSHLYHGFPACEGLSIQLQTTVSSAQSPGEGWNWALREARTPSVSRSTATRSLPPRVGLTVCAPCLRRRSRRIQ